MAALVLWLGSSTPTLAAMLMVASFNSSLEIRLLVMGRVVSRSGNDDGVDGLGGAPRAGRYRGLDCASDTAVWRNRLGQKCPIPL